MYQWLVRLGTIGGRSMGLHAGGKDIGDVPSRRMAKGTIRPLRMGQYLTEKGQPRDLGEEKVTGCTGNLGHIPREAFCLQRRRNAW